MPTVAEVSSLYGNILLAPRHGPDVCDVCCNLTDGYGRCYACSHGEQWLDAVAPISYSVAGEQLHHALRGYKRLAGGAGRRLGFGLAAVLWRFLAYHESCLATRAGVEQFDVVATVPSGAAARDEPHPLRRIVGEVVEPTRDRHRRLLRRTAAPVEARVFSADRFAASGGLARQAVLLVDDTWTSGASAQSAGAALKAAGAATVGAVVIGRHVNRQWRQNDRRLRALAQPFDWERCALCAGG